VRPGSDRHLAVPRAEALARAPAAPPTLLSVGAVKRRKGYDLALRAFRLVQERHPAARYWIVGALEQPAHHRSLLDLAAAEGLRNVEFLGQVSDERLDRCYREASVFLLAPRAVGLHFEGFGLVFLEAGAHGLPVAATRTGGVPDAVRHGETGLLAEPEDVAGLADAVLRLLDDPALAARLGRAGRDRAETLTWERYAAEQRAVYDRIRASPS
jgi:glycosyltransferase involved in cell wall biosynthesis